MLSGRAASDRARPLNTPGSRAGKAASRADPERGSRVLLPAPASQSGPSTSAQVRGSVHLELPLRDSIALALDGYNWLPLPGRTRRRRRHQRQQGAMTQRPRCFRFRLGAGEGSTSAACYGAFSSASAARWCVVHRNGSAARVKADNRLGGSAVSSRSSSWFSFDERGLPSRLAGGPGRSSRIASGKSWVVSSSPPTAPG